MKKYYDTLEIDLTATEEQIKKAYREKAKEFHPDKHINLNDGMKKLAEQEFKKISEAYEKIMESFNNKSTSFNNYQEQHEERANPYEYKLMGQSIVFSKRLFEHNKFRKIQISNANKAIKYAREVYTSSKNFERFFENLEKIADYLTSSLQEYVRIFNENGFTNFRGVNDILNVSSYSIFDELQSYTEYLEEEYIYIVENRRMATNQRLLKKEIRRIYNKGGVRNIISKAAISAEANIKISNLYKNPETLNRLYNAIFYFYERMTYVGCFVAEYPQWNEVTNPNNTRVILERISKNASASDFNLLKGALIDDPYEEGVYEAILVFFGDKDKELEKIGKNFGIDVLRMKNLIIEEAFDKKLASNYSKIQLKNEMEQMSLALGIRNDENIYYRRIDSAAKEEKEVKDLENEGYVGVKKIRYMIIAFIIGTMGIHKFYSKKYLHGIIYFLLGNFIAWDIPLALAWIDTAIALFKKANGNGVIFYKKGFLNIF